MLALALGGLAWAQTLVFSDDFESGDLSTDWTASQDVAVESGRVVTTENGQFIETLQEFTGDARIEVDVEKIGPSDHGGWDFAVELTSIPEASGVIRFDNGGVDGIAIGPSPSIGPAFGDQVTIDAAGVNQGTAVLTYSAQAVEFSFTNADGQILSAGPVAIGDVGPYRLKIHLAAHPDTPRYVDNVKIYALDDTGGGDDDSDSDSDDDSDSGDSDDDSDSGDDSDSDHGDDDAVMVRVKCNRGQSVNEALRSTAAELIVELEGVCREDVLIRRDRTTLRGVTADAAIVGSEQPEIPFGGGVTVHGATNVTLTDFTVRDGRRGVTVLSGGAARLERMTLRDNVRDGLFLFEASHAWLEDCEMTGNGVYGIAAWHGSDLMIRSPLVASDNGRLGLVASGNSSVGVLGTDRIEIDDNGLYGLVLQVGATAQLSGASQISTNGNGTAGIVIFYDASLTSAGEVRNNGTYGAYVGYRSFLSFGGDPVTDNGVFGIYAEQDASLDYGGPEISGHDVGLYLDGTEAILQNTAVSDPVELAFGTRVDFAGGNSFTGGVNCDDTVVVRGDVSCPAPSSAPSGSGLRVKALSGLRPLEPEP